MSDYPNKRQKTDSIVPLTAELSRPFIPADSTYAALSQGNVITVVEDTDVKCNLLRVVLAQSIVSQQSSIKTSNHRAVLFIVDDDVAQYATELESMGFSVGSYTVAMHNSGISQWPTIIHNDIVVVAANLLLDSLVNGSFDLSQAHTVVISDARRVLPMVVPHPAITIVSEFHAKMPNPPNILAILSSPANRWAALDLATLEASLHARAFFLQTNSVVFWCGPMELVVEYTSQVHALLHEPSLSVDLRISDPQSVLIKSHHYRDALSVFSQLGSFAVNLYWQGVINNALQDSSLADPALFAKLGALVAKCAAQKLDTVAESDTNNATPKLTKLLQLLQPCVKYGLDFRGVVLVKSRAVARVLAELLCMALSFIRTAALTSDISRNCEKTESILRDYDTGVCNLLIMTKSSEDMDVARSPIIINFDLFDDQLSYAYTQIHSKGQHSHLIHMVEKDNNDHRRMLSRCQVVDDEMRSWFANTAYGQDSFPPKNMHISLDPCRSDDEDSDDTDYVIDASTTARVYRYDAIPTMYRFVAEVHSSLGQHQQSRTSLSLEECTGENKALSYRYTIAFPESTRLPTIVGTFCATKWEARREVCYEACKELVRVGLMHPQHFPRPRPITAGDSTAVLDVKTANASAKTHGYPRKTPDFWANSRLAPPTVLYPTVIAPEDLGEGAHAPVLLLTRAALPPVPEFALFYCGVRAAVRFYKGAPLEVDEGQLRALHGYTTRVARSLTNKPVGHAFGTLLCFFAPLDAAWNTTISPEWPLLSVAEHILWDAVQLAADYRTVPLVDGISSIDERAKDAIVQDRSVEFTMRQYVTKVRHDLTPLSKAEDSSREAEFASFLEYCNARIKDFQGLEDENQPMIEVSPVPPVMNILHPTAGPPNVSTKAPLKYIIPELCHKFTIPASTFRTLWLMPSVMDKLDSYLLTKELNAKLFHNTILEQQLLIALSPPATWTEANYERLEFLGDSFLKVVASNFCYAMTPTTYIGDLHQARADIVSNKVLQEGATRVGLPSYIQNKRFVAKLWHLPVVPEPSADDGDIEMADDTHEQEQKPAQNPGAGKGKGRSKRQRQKDEQNTLWMGNKTIADAVEAILAASFLSGGHEAALQTARRLQVPIPNVAQWADFVRIAAEHVDAVQEASIPAFATTLAVEGIVCARFLRPELLGQALTHPSTFAGDNGISYDRLEFVGDAVLDFLVSRYIWERHPSLSPGGLTMLKAAMVSNQTLAAFGVHVGLHKHLRIDSSQLSGAIERYADFLEELRKKEYDFAAREDRLPGQYWLDMPMEPPKCLSDVVESTIGALYVGDNFFEVGVGRFFENVFKPFLEAHVRLQTLSTNPKATLLEFLQAEGCRDHAVVKQQRGNTDVQMDVVIHGKVFASATDASAVVASRRVSLAALNMLVSEPMLLSRMCDCQSAPGTTTAPKKEPVQQDRVKTEEEEDAAEVEAAMAASTSMEVDEDA